MNLLKRFANWILEDELNTLNKKVESNLKLAKSLGDRLQTLHPVPPILPNGKDMSDTIQWNIDLTVAGCLGADAVLDFPKGNIVVNTPIIVTANTPFKGDK